jgi:hypothetical protein
MYLLYITLKTTTTVELLAQFLLFQGTMLSNRVCDVHVQMLLEVE